jgi:hypothetical protein
MASGFNVFRRLETGELVRIAWRPDLGGAEKLARDLNEHFPAEYGIEEAASKPLTCVPYAQAASRWSN